MPTKSQKFIRSINIINLPKHWNTAMDSKGNVIYYNTKSTLQPKNNILKAS